MASIVCVWNKTNKTRECEVLGVYENMMTIVHPNGNIYTTTISQEDNRRYNKGDKVKAVFDELHEWDTMYSCKGLKR